MRGVQARAYPRVIVRSMAAAAPGGKSAQAENTEQAKQIGVWSAGLSALGGQEVVPPEELQEVLWKQYFADTALWWDNRRCKPTPRHPDFKHKETKVPLWLNNRHKPVWVDSQLASMDAGLQTIPGTGPSKAPKAQASASAEGHSDVGMCSKLCQDGVISEAVDALDLLVQRGCTVPRNLFYVALKRCTQMKALALGRRIHALIVRSGYEGDAFLGTHLIGLYASHGRLEEAMEVFTKIATPDAYNWAAIIFAYARQGETAAAVEAIRLYRQLCESAIVEPDDRLYSAVLKACAVAKDVIVGKEIHARIAARPRNPDRFVQTGLVNMYAKCGSLEEARRLFDTLSEKDVVTWNTMIAGYVQQEMGQDAVNLYRIMQQESVTRPCSLTYACLLQACGSLGDGALHDGRQLHAEIRARGLEQDVVLGASLVNMYVKCGCVEDARSLFERLPDKDVVTWTTMIAGYAQKGMGREALSLYRSMQEEGLAPDSVTYVCLLQACGVVGSGALQDGKQLHAQIRERGWEEHAVLSGSLVDMYVKCGCLEDGRRLLDKLPGSTVAWTVMIAGYVRQGSCQEALNLYSSMQRQGLVPDSVTFVCLLQACANLGVDALYQGKKLHLEIIEQGLEDHVVLSGSLLNMYASCGSLDDARTVFDKLSDRNVVTWNAMITGYAQKGMGQEALNLYSSMQQEGLFPDSVTYVCLLQACAVVGADALHQGKQLHSQFREQGLEEDAVVCSSLVNMYAKCGSLHDGRMLLNKLSESNIVAWTAMIAGYVQEGMGEEALTLYRCMQQEGVIPDSVTYVRLLQACASIGVDALHQGRELHAWIEQRGMERDALIGESLVNMYAKCGSVVDARRLFENLPNKNVVAWNSMIAGYVQQGMGEDALYLHTRMHQEGLTPDFVTYVCLLQACASIGFSALHEGELLHTQIKDQGLEEDVVLGGSLVNMYVKCGSLEAACRLFDKLPVKNVVSFNAMIAGYVQQGMNQKALGLYSSMQHDGLTPNSVTYVCLLQACAAVGVGAFYEGKQLHAQVKNRGLERDAVLGGSLLNMYAKCGSLEDACRLFDNLPDKNVVAWNTMIAVHAQQGMGEEALRLYSRMQQGYCVPDCVTYVSLLQACASVGAGALNEGEKLHSQIAERGLEEDSVLGGSLVNMYAKCGSLECARSLFHKLQHKSVAVWNAMIAGYNQEGMGEEALRLYRSMQHEGRTPSSVTYVCLLQACATVGPGALHDGKQLHVQIEERGLKVDAVLAGSLINMYAKCGSLEDARRLFIKLPERNVVAWNAMIAGYIQQGMSQDAISLYSNMRQEGIAPNSVTYICLLQACGALAALPSGQLLHADLEGRGMVVDANVGAALINMYAKCGSISDSQRVFDSLPEKSMETWNALISGYARQGDSKSVFDSLARLALDGKHPDEITFLSVLTVCSHVGLVDKGREYFEAMKTVYSMGATMDHYVCMVDLLGRAGHLHEALQTANNMPFPPSNVVWHTLLAACRKWKSVEIGEQAFQGAISVDEKNAAVYVLMSNIYASTQMWDEAKEIMARRLKYGAWKKPGQSWCTDMEGVVHTFLVQDK